MPLSFVYSQDEIKSLVPSSDFEAGARVLFHGTVRAINYDKAVKYLAYEAYEELAKNEFLALEKKTKSIFGVRKIMATHLIGEAGVGEIAVVIEVLSKHRKEAFLAARFVMDELKKSIPIWKCEYFEDGTKSFAQGPCGCGKDFEPIMAPVRKALLANQIEPELLRQKKILLIGAGGLGCPLALHLGALGIGHMAIYDGDVVAKENLARQFIFSPEDIGQSKAKLIANFLSARFPVLVKAVEKMLDEKDAICFNDFDAIIDASDCMATKLMAAFYARKFQVPFISASVFRDEGELSLIFPHHDEGCFSCYRRENSASSCQDTGVFTHTCGLIAAEAASLALDVLTQKSEKNKMRLFTKSGLIDIALKKDPHCRRCSPLKSYDIRSRS